MSASARGTARPSTPVDWGIGAAAAAVCVGIGLAPVFGHRAFDVPRNDDWVYFRAAETFHRAGSLAPDPFSNAMAAGQSLLAAPIMALVGPSFAAVHTVGALMVFLALLFTYLTCRHVTDRAIALFVTLGLGLSAQMLPLAGSFMTDAPAMAFTMAALWAGGKAFRRDRVRVGWFSLALLLVLASMTIRETSVVGLLALLLTALWASRRTGGRLRALVPSIGLCLATLAALLIWRSQQSTPVQRGFAVSPGLDALGRSLTTWTTISLMVLPALGLLVQPLIAAVRRRPVTALGIALIATHTLVSLGSSLLGNYLTPRGVAPETIHGTPPSLIPVRAFGLLVVLAQIGVVAQLILLVDTVANLWQAWRNREEAREVHEHEGVLVLLTLYVLGVVSLTMLMPFGKMSIFDRYLLPAAPLLSVLWLRAYPGAWSHRVSRILGVGALSAMSLLGVVIADGSATFDGGKWRAGQIGVAAGIEPKRLNGGYEWFGYWQNRHIEPRVVSRQDAPDFWTPLFPDPGICAEVHMPDWKPWYLFVGHGTKSPQPETYAPGVWRRIGAHEETTMLGRRYRFEVHTTTPTCAPR